MFGSFLYGIKRVLHACHHGIHADKADNSFGTKHGCFETPANRKLAILEFLVTTAEISASKSCRTKYSNVTGRNFRAYSNFLASAPALKNRKTSITSSKMVFRSSPQDSVHIFSQRIRIYGHVSLANVDFVSNS